MNGKIAIVMLLIAANIVLYGIRTGLWRRVFFMEREEE